MSVNVSPLYSFFESGSDISKENIADVVLREAFLEQVKGNDQEAIRKYKEYLKIGRESSHVLSQFSQVLSRNSLHDEAIKYSKKALELNRDDPSIYISYANVLRNGEKNAEAVEILKIATKKFKNNPEIEFYLAEIYYETSQIRSAQIHYKQVLFHADRSGSNSFGLKNVALWRMANIYLKESDYENSLIYFVRFVKSNPGNLYARYILGYHLYFTRGQYDKALRELEKIIEYDVNIISSQNVDVYKIYSSLGKIYYLKKDYRARIYIEKAIAGGGGKDILDNAIYLLLQNSNEKAYPLIVKYLEKNPVDYIARVALYRLLAAKNTKDEILVQELFEISTLAGDIGQHQSGLQMTEEAFRLKSNNPALDVSLSLLNQQLAQHFESINQPYRTIYYLKKSIEEGDHEKRWNDPLIRINLTVALSRLLSSQEIKRYDEALAVCTKLIEANPDHSGSFYARGVVFYKKGDYQNAVRDFTRAIELNENNYLYLFFRSVAYHEMNEFEKTESDLLKVLELKPDFAEANNFLGYLYAEHSIKLDRAEELIEKAIQISPTSGAFQDSLGWLYYKNRKFDEALYHLQLSSLLLEEMEMPDPVVYDHLGDVYFELKYLEKAVVEYKRAFNVLKKKEKTLRNSDVKYDLTAEEKDLLIKVEQKILKLNQPDQLNHSSAN